MAAPALAAVLTVVAGCQGGTGASGASAPRLEPLDNPAPAGTAQPGLTVSPSGQLYLSWQERRPDSTWVLRFAVRAADSTGAWSAARDVQTGANMLTSATDVPSVDELPGGRLVAAWRGKHASTGYDIVVAHSDDHGATWSAPRSPHRDSTATEHGFVSWLRVGDASGMVWVDGRNNALPDTAQRATQLAFATFDAAGDVAKESFVDTKICDCCHTSAAAVPGGAVVAYRDRHDGEIRDISVVRVAGGAWRTPVSVHDDQWHYIGCPVNGPAIAARGARVAVAWFTSAHDTARVRLAFSGDTAGTFGAPIEVNEGTPDGKVGVAMTATGDALVSWIERRGTTATLRLRRIAPDGSRSAVTDVATLGEGRRAGGMPKLVQDGDAAILGWTDAADDRIRTARVALR